MLVMFTWMQAQNEALIRLITAVQKLTKPQQALPRWEGKEHTMPDFIERLNTYKDDAYFSGADYVRDRHLFAWPDPILQKNKLVVSFGPLQWHELHKC